MILIYCTVAFIILIVLYIPLPYVLGRLIRLLQGKRAIFQKTIYLTFDDGPGNRLTPRILKLLKEKGIRATFFVLSKNVAGREDILRSIAENGHLIASHSYSHFNAWKVTPWKSIMDIKKGWKILNAELLSGNMLYLYRPPCGKLNMITFLYLWLRGVPVIFWTIDCLDTCACRDVEYAGKRIQINKGGIVLFHDLDRATDYLDDYVLNSLQKVIDKGRELGLRFSTADELYNKGAKSK